MSRHLRRYAYAAVAATLLLGTAACGGGDEDGSAPASDGGTLTVSDWQWIVPDRGEKLWQGAEQYTKANPKAKLVKQSTPFADYANKLNTELGAGNGPDVFVVLDTQFVTLADAGLLEPLDDVLDGVELNKTNEAAKADGKQLGITWERVNYALLWNKTLLAQAGVKPPTTVDELIAAGKAVQAKTNARGFGVRHQMNDFEGWFQDFTNWVYGYGGAWSKDGELTLDSPENVEAVAAFKKVYDSGIMPIGDDASTMRTKFQQGQLAMMIDNSGAAVVDATAGKLTGKTMGGGPMPFPEAGTHQQLILAVNAHSKHKQLAKDFVAWVASEDGQKAMRPGIGPSTMATDVALDPAFAAANPWAAVFGPLAETSRATLVSGEEKDTKAILRHFMSGVEDVIVNDVAPDKALKQAQAEAAK